MANSFDEIKDIIEDIKTLLSSIGFCYEHPKLHLLNKFIDYLSEVENKIMGNDRFLCSKYDILINDQRFESINKLFLIISTKSLSKDQINFVLGEITKIISTAKFQNMFKVTKANVSQKESLFSKIRNIF